MFTVYKHIFPNGKVYIGITSQRIESRWRNNGAGYKTCVVMWKAIQKYGWENIKHEIIAENLTQEQACQMEIDLIKQYDSTHKDKGYNISFGGSASAYGMRHSEETKKKFSEDRKGCKNAFYGKHHTEETKRKNSIAHSGKNAYFYGKKRGFMKVHETQQKPLICVETGQIWASTKKASIDIGVAQQTISKACRKELQKVKGLTFRYLTEEEKQQWLNCM